VLSLRAVTVGTPGVRAGVRVSAAVEDESFAGVNALTNQR
jgi:hypothetical protein